MGYEWIGPDYVWIIDGFRVVGSFSIAGTRVIAHLAAIYLVLARLWRPPSRFAKLLQNFIILGIFCLRVYSAKPFFRVYSAKPSVFGEIRVFMADSSVLGRCSSVVGGQEHSNSIRVYSARCP